jgi:hypothetical protein
MTRRFYTPGKARRSSKRVGITTRVLSSRSRTVKYVCRRIIEEVQSLEATCCTCGANWVVVVRGDRPPNGWRKCPRGCNADRVSKG